FVYFTLFIRIGLGFTMPVVNGTALKALAPDEVNQGSGLINFLRMLGAAIWLNLIIAHLDSRVPFHSGALTASQTAANQTSQEMLYAVKSLLSEAGLAESVQTSGAIHYLGQVIFAQASTLGFQDAFLSLAVLAAVGLAPAWFLSRTEKQVAPPATK
ncbi:MAG: MFS transporter, partial [Rhodospirillaceae bacterium]|nr:MFS transporter [Rhodospirillaceae bacterium]